MRFLLFVFLPSAKGKLMPEASLKAGFRLPLFTINFRNPMLMWCNKLNVLELPLSLYGWTRAYSTWKFIQMDGRDGNRDNISEWLNIHQNLGYCLTPLYSIEMKYKNNFNIIFKHITGGLGWKLTENQFQIFSNVK